VRCAREILSDKVRQKAIRGEDELKETVKFRIDG
jgi:hypothetical protein